MKVLFDHATPFALAHGGFQIQIEQTKLALEAAGVEVEWLRWWDSTQTGDIIHFFGRPVGGYVDLAHKKGMKMILGELLTGLGSRSARGRRAQKALMTIAQKLLPSGLLARLAWDTYEKADAFVALTTWEGQLMREMFRAPAQGVYIVPNGVEEVFFVSPERRPVKENYFVCTATITERKRVQETAEAAVTAGVPLWVIGKPYSESDPYYRRFCQFAEEHREIIRFDGGISDRATLAKIYQGARGFALLSTMESLSLSALEAAAGGCPLFLSDLPWARHSFGDAATYCPVNASREETGRRLREFYERAPDLPPPPRPLTWGEVGRMLKDLYGETVSN